MINFGSSKLGVSMPKGSKTEETNDKIPRLALGYSLVIGLNVSVYWLIIQIIRRALSIVGVFKSRLMIFVDISQVGRECKISGEFDIHFVRRKP